MFGRLLRPAASFWRCSGSKPIVCLERCGRFSCQKGFGDNAQNVDGTRQPHLCFVSTFGANLRQPFRDPRINRLWTFVGSRAVMHHGHAGKPGVLSGSGGFVCKSGLFVPALVSRRHCRSLPVFFRLSNFLGGYSLVKIPSVESLLVPANFMSILPLL